jgi:hypothetical protein
MDAYKLRFGVPPDWMPSGKDRRDLRRVARRRLQRFDCGEIEFGETYGNVPEIDPNDDEG